MRWKIKGHIFFVLSSCHSVIPSFCHSVNLSETLTLLIDFEQWKLELWNFTWVILVARPFGWYQHFLTCDLYLGVLPIFKKKPLTLLITFEQWVLELSYFTWVFYETISIGTKNFDLVTLTFEFDTFWKLFKIFVLVILVIFGLAHYQGHLCITNTSCLRMFLPISGIDGDKYTVKHVYSDHAYNEMTLITKH